MYRLIWWNISQEELTCKNTTYISDSGKSYDFNIADNIVGIENRDGNTNVRFYQKATLERIFNRLVNAGVHICVLAWIVAHVRKRLSAWLSHTASYSTFVQTDAHPYMTQCLPSRDGRKKKSMALSSNWTPFLSRNGRESHIDLSFRDKDVRMVRLTFGRENTHIDVSSPMTTRPVYVTS